MTQNEKALTLTEVLVSALLFAFIIAGLFSAALAANKSWQTFGAAVRARQEARKAVDSMTRDLRASQNLSIPPGGPGSLTFSFTRGSGTVTYLWSTAGAEPNRVIRQTATASRVIARNISALSVAQTGDVISIDVTASVASSRAQNETFRLVNQVTQRL